MGIKATSTDFFTRLNLDLFNSSSSAPSKTIIIKPTVPKTGKSGAKLGIVISTVFKICLTSHPDNKSKITDGTFVLDALKSNRYASSNSMHKLIMMVVVIICGKFNSECLSLGQI